MTDRPLAVVKGAGDLATGVAYRLHRIGFDVIMTEIAAPTVVRRTVAFAEAVFDGEATVEGMTAVLVESAGAALQACAEGRLAVIVDPQATVVASLGPSLLVDAVVAKRNLGTRRDQAPAVVALGPGFTAGTGPEADVHAVVETMRGHTLGRVVWEGSALPNTGTPGDVGGHTAARVLRAPYAGPFAAERSIGDTVAAGEVVARVGSVAVRAEIAGVLRGLIRDGLRVNTGAKVGDVDPRASRDHCYTISDKALAVAGGVLEAAGVLLGGFRPVGVSAR
jgi:xanthine dehydrogenase accessory factor